MLIRILLSIVLPPVAILMCGRPVQAFFNLVLCLLAIVSAGLTLAPAVVWALMVTLFWRQDEKERRLRRDLGVAPR